MLVLDEATSALDNTTERAIQRAINKIVSGTTTFAIAHRLTTIVHARAIFVFRLGYLVEAGAQAELLELGGVYQGIWAAAAADVDVSESAT